jgi:GTP-binding protein LepA
MEFEIPNSKNQNRRYILNLIDTPGHIDFSYEISRALACVEGAILLVDATKGIQAQTLFNLEQAKKQNLKIIGVVNKIDLPQAQISQTKKELSAILNVPESEIFAISAKKGTNVPELLKAIIEKIPPPRETEDLSCYFNHGQDNTTGKEVRFRALIFDSKYDPFSGVIAYVRVFEGEIKKGEGIYLIAQSQEGQAKEVGFFTPELKPCQTLKAGEIGYIKTGIKDPNKVRVGDTIIKISNLKPQTSNLEPLPGYKEPQSVLFLSLYPENSDEFSNLKASLEKLKLQDPALEFQPESKMALGRGVRVGFLGSLHAEITIKRLKQEFGQELILTSPQVIFKILTKKGEELSVSSPHQWPQPFQIKEIREPWVKLEIITPNSYFSQVFKILKNFRAHLKNTKFLTSQKSLLEAEAPLREIITGNFYDKLKSLTQGYASFSFQASCYKKADLVKLDILVAGKIQPPLAKIVPRDKAFSEAKKILQKLKETLPPQQFPVALQAAIGGKIIARETIKALRKDVTAPLYGGDVTRKRKLLEIQKKGKQKLKERGKLTIPPQVFLEMLKGN